MPQPLKLPGRFRILEIARQHPQASQYVNHTIEVYSERKNVVLPKGHHAVEGKMLSGPLRGQRVFAYNVRLERIRKREKPCECDASPFPHRPGSVDGCAKQETQR